jgi:hypothetical protein
VTGRVSIRATFERFPASVKGAFVMRSADPDPHQVAIREARVAEASGAGARPIGLAPAVLDVAPNRDLFVPFEFPVVELGPGWYGLECDVDIDGSPTTVRPPKRFAIPWPRGTVRRGQIPIGRAVALEGGPKVHLGTLELTGDSARLGYSAEEPVDVRLVADDGVLAAVEEAFDEETGAGRLCAYPVMRAHRSLRVEVRASGKPRSRPATVDVKLPSP